MSLPFVQQQHEQSAVISTSMKRSPSTESLGGGTKTCVCAPTTHAGSFRCRLHRTTSSSSSSTAASHQAPPQLPPPAPPAISPSASRTVEAQ